MRWRATLSMPSWWNGNMLVDRPRHDRIAQSARGYNLCITGGWGIDFEVRTGEPGVRSVHFGINTVHHCVLRQCVHQPLYVMVYSNDCNAHIFLREINRLYHNLCSKLGWNRTSSLPVGRSDSMWFDDWCPVCVCVCVCVLFHFW